MINAKLQNLYNIKNDIGTAIVNKGGTITESTPFYSYAGQIDNISTGTPQTVFQDSTGAKWAFTNTVNLTNDSGNVTHDFNWLQPANASTSDPILTGGTVGANISGNIRIVQVNQVNIAQYVNIVATDTLGSKYVGFNGFDFVTNPTPTNTATFNRWLLNNSATGTVIFANATFTTETYNGPNIVDASLKFINNTANHDAGIRSITTNNGFIYVGGDGFPTNTVKKYYESNLAFVNNTASYGGIIFSIVTNDGFIYAGGRANQTVQKFGESNLVRVGNSTSYGGQSGSSIRALATNGGFIFAGGDLSDGAESNGTVRKYRESNLQFVTSSNDYGWGIHSLTTNNGFVYVGGWGSGYTGGTVKKYHESNLVFVGNTPSYGSAIRSVTTNNGFIYAGGQTNQTVQKFYESNLAFVGNTPNYNGAIFSITTNNGFIYAGGTELIDTNRGLSKYYESNLAFVGSTVNYGGTIFSLAINDGFIYAGGGTNQTVQKFQESGTAPETLTFYTATKIKEDI